MQALDSPLNAVVLNGGFAFRGHLAMSGDFFDGLAGGWGVWCS